MRQEPTPATEDRTASDGPAPPWSVGRGVKLMLLGWGVGFSAAGLVSVVFRTEGISAAGNIAGLGAMAWIGHRMSRRPFREVFSIRGFRPRLLVPIILMTLGGMVLVAEVGNLMEEIAPVPQVLRDLFLKVLLANDWQGFLWRAALLSLVAPVTEEMVFRGVFQSGFVERYGVGRGVAASSLCFGVFHLIPWQAVSTTLIGVLLGLVVHRTGSIFAGMAMHAIWNLLPLLAVSLWRNAALPGYDFQGQEVQHIPVPVLLVSAALVWSGLYRFWRCTEGLHSTMGPAAPSDSVHVGSDDANDPAVGGVPESGPGPG